ncbi:TPA: aminopeptidase P family protein [Campylobacter jejuni]|nr:aminopeptidase P family protein [Campylobacter jejuni]ECL6333557.1 aminopeptidase P family protein [Campylobacter jejuni]ECO5692706.1 aminopeptidase P family protein [Campylobacter jejuni]EDP4646784.1 aminopeptidase P family protein [Campylobacter jejuni]EHY7559518.1 aminopeptidase P family protein [Campylobacter jejuni]
MSIYKQRVLELRRLMKENNIDAYLILSADPHLSEYLPEYYKNRVFISGFKGSVGTVLITQEEGFLWVDGRYWLQAQKELEGSGILLQKQDAKNTFTKWLEKNLNEDQILGIDFALLPLSLQKDLQINCKVNLKHIDLISPLWKDRPTLPQEKIYEHELEYCSYSRKEKLALVRQKMKNLNATSHLISSLDDIAWLTNLRGNDVNYNPVFLSHLLILEDKALLFVDQKKVNSELEKKLNLDGFWLKNYDEIIIELEKLTNTNLLIEPSKMTALLINSLDKSVKIIQEINPSTHLKAAKNTKEITHIQDAMIEDGVALCKFFAWLEEAIENKELISELDIDTKASEFRAQSKYYISDSFATIAGFNENAAYPHYKATKESFAYLKKDGLLLIDSGGQYKNGTTDITRVVPIGKANAEQIHDYTLVLKAHIAISSAIFPKDIAMPLLDAITRVPLWKEQIDYIHGTGHGVGYFLNVHEGPQVLSYLSPVLEKTKAKEGMLTSIEPGIYKVGKWGIRLENLVIHTKVENPKNKDFGEFLYFKPVTLCPFEISCIDTKMLDEKEKEWLNNYHKEVFEKLSPKLGDYPKALAWLEKRTKAIF